MQSTILEREVCFTAPHRTSATIARLTDDALVAARTLRHSEPLLHRLGWTMLALVLPLSVAAASNADLIDDGVVNPWIKPIKFALSLSMLLWTLGLLLRGLRMPARWRRAMREVAALGAAAELAFVTWQAGRAVHAPGSATPVDRFLVGGASVAILAVCASCIAVAGLYFDAARVRVSDAAMVTAIRHGLVVFVVGSAIGGYILARGSHVVGAAADGPTMPLTSWSADGGDLRIAHFIALHAVQIVPMVAWVLAVAVPGMTVARRTRLVRAASAAVATTIAFTLIQALLAHPIV